MTALVAHGLTVAWGAFQVSRTNHNKFIYKELIVRDLCGGKDVIPEFWSIRMNNFVSTVGTVFSTNIELFYRSQFLF